MAVCCSKDYQIDVCYSEAQQIDGVAWAIAYQMDVCCSKAYQVVGCF